MNNDDILTRIHQIYPDLIYVAIGPARNAEQQLPPQIRAWPGQKACILIDPLLESPPLVHSGGDAVIIPVYRCFEWADQADVDLIRALCRFVMGRTNAHMIVQDYSGDDIYPYYPGAEFLPRVLFNMTYGEGSCYVDFATVQILRDRHGDFIQPHFATFVQLCSPVIPAAIRKIEVMARRCSLINYLHYYYRMRSHEHPAEDWLATVESNIRNHINQFALIYGGPASTTLNNLRILTERATLDLSAATNVAISPEDLTNIIESPERNVFGNAIGMLCGLLN
jgi:hypothetical protein